MNKLFGLFLLALACWAPNVANAAACFWVGGTGNINDTTKWSNATGGSASTCAAAGGWPNSGADTATFDASSGGGTITRNVNWTVGTLTMNLFTGTLGNSGDTASVDIGNLANTGAGTRTLNLGASTWTVGNTGGGSGWNQNGATNLTFNANTSTVRSIAGVAQNQTVTMNLGTFTYNVVTLQGTAVGGATSMQGSSPTIGTFNIQAPNYLIFSNATNWTVTGSLVFSGGGVNAWTGFATTAPNNSVTLTLSGGGATCNYCSFRDVTAVTNGITATNSIDYGRASNITITPPSLSGGGGGRIIGG